MPFKEDSKMHSAYRSVFWITTSMHSAPVRVRRRLPHIHLMNVETGEATYGVGISSNITRASIRGIFSAVNRLFYK